MKLVEKFKEFKKSENKENFILQNISFISFLLLLTIWGLFIIQNIFCVFNNIFDLGLTFQYLDLKYLITTSGAIGIFRYGYKKYERDKELEILEKYGKKYDEINSMKVIELKFKKILNLCEEEFYLYKKGYISKFLWKRIEFKIDKNLQKIIEEILNEFNDNIKNHGINESLKIPSKYSNLFFSDDIGSNWKGYGIFIISRLNEIKNDRQTIIDNKNKCKYLNNDSIQYKSKNYIFILDSLIEIIEDHIELQKIYFNN